jgi:hypothetical protein
MNAVYDLFALVNEAIGVLETTGHQNLAVKLAIAKLEARPEVKKIIEDLYKRERESQYYQEKCEDLERKYLIASQELVSAQSRKPGGW